MGVHVNLYAMVPESMLVLHNFALGACWRSCKFVYDGLAILGLTGIYIYQTSDREKRENREREERRESEYRRES